MTASETGLDVCYNPINDETGTTPKQRDIILIPIAFKGLWLTAKINFSHCVLRLQMLEGRNVLGDLH